MGDFPIYNIAIRCVCVCVCVCRLHITPLPQRVWEVWGEVWEGGSAPCTASSTTGVGCTGRSGKRCGRAAHLHAPLPRRRGAAGGLGPAVVALAREEETLTTATGRGRGTRQVSGCGHYIWHTERTPCTLLILRSVSVSADPCELIAFLFLLFS